MTTTSNPNDPASSVAPLPNDPGATAAAGLEERVRIRGPLARLLLLLLPANFGIFLLWGAIPGVMLQLQVMRIDPSAKIANVALITTVGAFAAMIAQPIAGAISDRTRTRFGRRAPWMVIGAIVGALALVGLAFSHGVVQVLVAWTAIQISYNFVQGPLSAIMPDRVPVTARGTFAALTGVGAMVGAVGGSVVGAAFSNTLAVGYIVLALVALVVTGLLVLFAKDSSSVDLPREPFRLIDFLRTFWVNPIAHPDFFWAFAGRLLLYTGYFAVTGYNLYVLQDYIGLKGKAIEVVPLLSILSLVGMIPAMIIGGLLSDRLGRRKIFVFFSTIVVGIALIMPMIMPTEGGMMLMSVIAGFGFGSFQAVDQALMTQVLPNPDAFAKDLGVVNIAATLPQTLAPAVGGMIVLTFGYIGLFPVGIVLSVIGAFAVFFIKSVR